MRRPRTSAAPADRRRRCWHDRLHARTLHRPAADRPHRRRHRRWRLGGYMHGDLVGGGHDRSEQEVGAGIGALAPAARVGDYMDRQEAELAARPPAPASTSSARATSCCSACRPASPSMSAARTSGRNSSRRSTRSAQTLKQLQPDLGRRPRPHRRDRQRRLITRLCRSGARQSVARLSARPAASPVRGSATRAMARRQPIADNDTEIGQATNRRVEIKIVPFRSRAQQALRRIRRRRAAKKARSSAAASSSPIPPSTSGR